MVRVAQCSPGDGMISTTDCGVTVVQSVPLSGRAINKLSVFGQFVAEVTFVKVTKDNNYGVRVGPLHTQYLLWPVVGCKHRPG